MNEMYLVQAWLEWQEAIKRDNEATLALLGVRAQEIALDEWAVLREKSAIADKNEQNARKRFTDVSAKYAEYLYKRDDWTTWAKAKEQANA